MAVRHTAVKDRSAAAKAQSDGVEQKVVALAEQLGGFVGTVTAKADGWLDRAALRKEVARIRDSAANLLEQMNRAVEAPAPPAPPPAAAPKVRASRGGVDAPGKRHRKPPPQKRLDTRMGEPVGKKMGQKNFKNRIRSGRG
jgi:hypothetical protein